MSAPVRLAFRSELRAPQSQVLAQAQNMSGVNFELAPWVRMTVPQAYAQRSLFDATADELTRPLLFRSVLLALGVLPFDVHAFHLDRVLPGEGFDERSSSWMQKTWIHRRRVVAHGDGCVVTDELEIEPRIAFMTPVVRAIVGFLFRHRHRRLAARYGTIKMHA